jgi:RND family efflux transporter MFP subunit
MVDAAHEDVQRIEEEIWKKTLRAPFTGYISAKYTEKGQWLQDGAEAVEVVELKELEVEVKVPERFLAAIKEGQPAKVQIEALGAMGEQALRGEIIRVVPQVDPQSRTLPIKIRLANRIDSDNRPWIKAGQLVQVALQVGRQNSLLIPKDALVLSSGRDPVVYVASEATDVVDGAEIKKTTARPVTVKTGNSYENYMAVQGDLKPGVQLIVRGNERVMPGQEIKASPYK